MRPCLQGNAVQFFYQQQLLDSCSYHVAQFDLLYLHCDKGQSGRTVLDVSDGPQTFGGEMV